MEVTKGKITAVIGAQYGSEGKGAIVAHLANKYDVHVRVGSPNAGHTFYWNGEKHVQQSIPCGWINPNARIIIGRGALINMKLLMNELEEIEKYYPDFRKRFYIDSMAGILDEKFHQQEGGIDGEMHRRIGSTGEGVGIARIARLKRDPNEFHLFRDVAKSYGLMDVMMDNTPRFIAEMQDSGMNIMLEGSQGSGLSLLHSHYPYCTSIDTNAAAILSEVGIAPSRLNNVLLIARTYPIRVAGNSGYMKNEITWDEVSKRAGRPVIEKTTVTHKVRRIAEWDDDLFKQTLVLNGYDCDIALTFADYLDYQLYGETDPSALRNNAAFLDFVNKHIGWSHLKYVGTGEQTVIDIQEEAND